MNKSVNFRKWIFIPILILFHIILFYNISKVGAIHEMPWQKLEKWGPVGFIFLQLLQVLIAPIPGHVLGVAGGALFGTIWGGIYSLIALTGGGLILFFLTRRFGRHLLNKFIGEEKIEKAFFKVEKFEKRIQKSSIFNHSPFNHLTNNKVFYALFIMYLFPGFPDDILALLAGLTRMKTLPFFLVLLLGRAPGIFLLASIGEGATHLPQFLQWLTF
jgi:uncharacterized membrane protein YdjX (TVP38/TMEM64 family)